ncbi:unnamed protein product [Mytilus edulis]|uniref:Uncharacterized protein n=1 Tax=Mytilus edulis TaxID=6550 RepID=A0A8S3RHD0_MYTED|nr:unnamed protein product [Mytilus edulis]
MTDHITQNLSTELYRYMCQSIVGTEDNVKQIRLMNAIRDDLSIHKNEISITSGSYGEGLDMRGSDLDVMYVVQNIKVYDVKPRLNPISAYLLMDTDNVKPGFTQLRLDNMDAKAAAYNLLGVALQTVGETETARQAYLLSAKLHIDPTDNPAVKRLFLLD